MNKLTSTAPEHRMTASELSKQLTERAAVLDMDGLEVTAKLMRQSAETIDILAAAVRDVGGEWDTEDTEWGEVDAKAIEATK